MALQFCEDAPDNLQHSNKLNVKEGFLEASRILCRCVFVFATQSFQPREGQHTACNTKSSNVWGSSQNSVLAYMAVSCSRDLAEG